MKLHPLAFGLMLIGSTAPAFAQTVPDDVRCLLLSNLYSRATTNERARQVAAQTLLFYLGRLDGRASDQAIIAAIRSQVPTSDPKVVGAQMNACTARMTRARTTIEALGRRAQPNPRP